MRLSRIVWVRLLVSLVVMVAIAFLVMHKSKKTEDEFSSEAPGSEFESMPKEVIEAVEGYKRACGGMVEDEVSCRMANMRMADAITSAQDSQKIDPHILQDYVDMTEREMESEKQGQVASRKEPSAAVNGYPSDAYPLGTECEYKANLVRQIVQFVLSPNEYGNYNYGDRLNAIKIKIQSDQLAGNLTLQEAATAKYIVERSWGKTPVEAGKNAYGFCLEGRL